MSKHQAILDYLEKLPVGKRVSVRSISNYLQVSDDCWGSDQYSTLSSGA